MKASSPGIRPEVVQWEALDGFRPSPEWLEGLPGWVARPEVEIRHLHVEHDRRAVVVPGPAGEPCFVKCYGRRRGTWLARLTESRARARIRRTFAYQCALWQAGVAVPRPLGIVAYAIGAGESVWAVVMEYLRGTTTLHETIFEHYRGEAGSGAGFAAIAAALVSSVSALHRLGLVHGDLNPHNLMLDRGGVDRAPRVYVTDFDFSTRPRGQRRRVQGQVADLARLGAYFHGMVPDDELRRWLDQYLEHTDWDAARRDGFRRRVARKRKETVATLRTAFHRVATQLLDDAEAELRSVGRAE